MANLISIAESTVNEEKKEFLTVLPVSVIDIEAQGKRKNEDHNKSSSRANYSPFPEEVATLCCEFFLRDSTTIFDPFAGWGERHKAALSVGKNYVGYDISQVAIDKAYADYGVKNTLADSLIVSPPEFDGLLTCPPYWNLEKYDSEDGLDRDKTWPEFINNLEAVFKLAYDTAKVGSTFCIMVGDWRSKGIYYDLEHEVSRMFKSFGASIVDKVVVSRKKVSKIKIMLPQCKRLGYSVRVHENLLVFRKVT